MLIAAAQSVPPLINYQGRLFNSNNIPVATGDYELRFSIWSAASGGTKVWEPQVFNGQTGPGFSARVPIIQGWFNVILGPVDTNGASISEAFGSTNRYFQVQIGGSPPITPRQQVLTTPYAFQSTRAESAARVDNFVTTNTRTFYVSTNGSDVNTGLSFISAKRTIRSALDAIPFNILHEVQILVYPGTYTEWLVINKNPRCGYDSELGMLRSWLSIKGMGSIPDAVKIRNLDLFGSRLHMVNLTVEGGVGLNYNASADFNSCRFVGPAAAMALNFGSVAIIEDCIFDGPGTNTTAIFASERSQLILQDDHIRQNGSDDIPGSHR